MVRCPSSRELTSARRPGHRECAGTRSGPLSVLSCGDLVSMSHQRLSWPGARGGRAVPAGFVPFRLVLYRFTDGRAAGSHGAPHAVSPARAVRFTLCREAPAFVVSALRRIVCQNDSPRRSWLHSGARRGSGATARVLDRTSDVRGARDTRSVLLGAALDSAWDGPFRSVGSFGSCLFVVRIEQFIS